MAQPNPSTAAWNTSAVLPSASATSPTTSLGHCSNPADSDQNYTLDSEEPVKRELLDIYPQLTADHARVLNNYGHHDGHKWYCELMSEVPDYNLPSEDLLLKCAVRVRYLRCLCNYGKQPELITEN